MKQLLLLAPLALSACIGPFARTTPYAYDKKGELVEFNYAWPAEVSANRLLARRLRADLERSFKAAEAAALADRADATAMNRSFKGHQYSRRWTTAGQSMRLLSLDGRLLTSTGAQPSHGVDALLWDRGARAELRAANLFASSSALDTLVRQPGCAILDLERAKRRGGEIKSGDAFAQCPPLAALALVPSDGDHNRRFDHFRLIAANSVAGAEAEGSYDINVPITATLLAAIKPAYRAGFEVAQPQ